VSRGTSKEGTLWKLRRGNEGKDEIHKGESRTVAQKRDEREDGGGNHIPRVSRGKENPMTSAQNSRKTCSRLNRNGGIRSRAEPT